MPTVPPRRGLSNGVQDEDRGVGEPTLWGKNRFFCKKPYHCRTIFFVDEIFLYPPQVKLPVFFGRLDFLKCRGPSGDIIRPQGQSWTVAGGLPNQDRQRPLSTYIHREDNRRLCCMIFLSSVGGSLRSHLTIFTEKCSCCIL